MRLALLHLVACAVAALFVLAAYSLITRGLDEKQQRILECELKWEYAQNLAASGQPIRDGELLLASNLPREEFVYLCMREER